MRRYASSDIWLNLAGIPLAWGFKFHYYSSMMSIEERAKQRKKRIVAHISRSFEEAERWDLEYWQNLSPASRLSALVAIRRDIGKVNKSRMKAR